MYLFFDTETTGLPLFKEANDHPGQPHIMQIAARLTTRDFQDIAYLDTLIKPTPDWKPHPKALETHGITVAQCEADGIAIESIIRLFDILDEQASLRVAHNIDFDARLLRIARARLGLPDRPESQQFCTMKTLTPIIRLPGKFRGFKWPTLQEAHEWAFGEGFEGAHSAMVDVDALVRVFRHMVEKDLVDVA